MRTNTITKNMIKVLIFSCLIIAWLAVLSTFNYSLMSASAESDAIYNEDIENENLDADKESNEYEYIIMLSSSGGRSDDVVLISGKNNYSEPFPTCLISEFTNKNI